MTLTRPRDSAAEAFSRREAAGPTRCGRSSGLIAWTAVAAGLAAAALIFYWPVTIGGGIFTDYDLLVYFYPQQQYLGEQLRRGSLPLWNPYLFGGVPFLANIQTGVFYPPNWITAVLPPPYATTALTLFHAWLAAAGLVVLGRQLLGLGWAGALAAGVTFAFGGFLTQQASHPNQLATAAWLPWLLVLYDRARRPGGRLWVLPGCLAVAAL
ncbi:MAG TPA: hypothetical protein VHL09_03695, partial [Dehalococcoidia bacterium]|nr:hypothetical protein [Dehalococcoidia bacterium]